MRIKLLIESTIDELQPEIDELISLFAATGDPHAAKEVITLATKVKRLEWLLGQLDAIDA